MMYAVERASLVGEKHVTLTPTPILEAVGRLALYCYNIAYAARRPKLLAALATLPQVAGQLTLHHCTLSSSVTTFAPSISIPLPFFSTSNSSSGDKEKVWPQTQSFPGRSVSCKYKWIHTQ